MDIYFKLNKLNHELFFKNILKKIFIVQSCVLGVVHGYRI